MRSCPAAERGGGADEAFDCTRLVPRVPDERRRLMPAPARNRGHRLAAYRRCSVDDWSRELVALEDGYRESAESWATLLRDLKRRGMEAPLVAVGDGALGFWAAAPDVWPETRAARCWCHKLANVLDKLPKRLRPRAKRLPHEAICADRRDHAAEAVEDFAAEFESKYPA
jgi:hypothetical protein